MLNKTKELAKQYGIRQLLIFTGMNCSQHCTYCFLPKGSEEMSTDTLFAAMEFLTSLTEQPSLHFFGTEPTMQWHLIEQARQKVNWPISLTTNGYLLTTKRIDWCNEHDVKVYVYSIDGGPHHNRHRLTRSGRESWDIVARHFRYLAKRQSTVTARATWTPRDYDLVGRFRALTDLGAPSIQVVPDIDGPPWDEEKVEQAYLDLGEHYKWGWTPSHYVNSMVASIKEQRPKPGNPCRFGYHSWAVMPDGTLKTCQRGEPIGNIWDGITNPAPLYESALCTVLLETRTPLADECEECVAFPYCPGVGYCCAANRAQGSSVMPTEAHCTHLRGMVRACMVWAKEQDKRNTARVILPQVLGVIHDRETA